MLRDTQRTISTDGNQCRKPQFLKSIFGALQDFRRNALALAVTYFGCKTSAIACAQDCHPPHQQSIQILGLQRNGINGGSNPS